MNTINWGIIGCGDVTEIKSGPAFNKIPGCKLVAVMRRDAAKAEDYARRHNVPKWYSNAGDLLNDPEINAVYIATPPAFHLEYAVAALSRGLNVYVEKPVTLNAHESRQMADAVDNSDALLSIAHYRRALPMFLTIKELIDDKIIGDILTVQIRLWQSPKPKLVANTEVNWRVLPEVSGGGYFHDLAPHQLDLMLFYFGQPEKYCGYALNQAKLSAADDNVSGQIIFKNKVVVNGSWCFNVAEAEVTDTCEIIGSKGKITFPFFGNYINIKTRGNEEIINFTHPPHIEQPMIAQVNRYFSGMQNNPCSIKDALILMGIMDSFTVKTD